MAAEAQEHLTTQLATAAAEHDRELGGVRSRLEAFTHELSDLRSTAADTEKRLNGQLTVALSEREREKQAAQSAIEESRREAETARASAAAEAEQHFTSALAARGGGA